MQLLHLSLLGRSRIRTWGPGSLLRGGKKNKFLLRQRLLIWLVYESLVLVVLNDYKMGLIFSMDIFSFWQWQVCLFLLNILIKKVHLSWTLTAAFSFRKATALSSSHKFCFWVSRQEGRTGWVGLWTPKGYVILLKDFSSAENDPIGLTFQKNHSSCSVSRVITLCCLVKNLTEVLLATNLRHFLGWPLEANSPVAEESSASARPFRGS